MWYFSHLGGRECCSVLRTKQLSAGAHLTLLLVVSRRRLLFGRPPAELEGWRLQPAGGPLLTDWGAPPSPSAPRAVVAVVGVDGEKRSSPGRYSALLRFPDSTTRHILLSLLHACHPTYRALQTSRVPSSFGSTLPNSEFITKRPPPQATGSATSFWNLPGGPSRGSKDHGRRGAALRPKDISDWPGISLERHLCAETDCRYAGSSNRCAALASSTAVNGGARYKEQGSQLHPGGSFLQTRNKTTAPARDIPGEGGCLACLRLLCAPSASRMRVGLLLEELNHSSRSSLHTQE